MLHLKCICHYPLGSLSLEVTSASANSWVPYASGNFQALLTYTQWFVCAQKLPEFLHKATKSPGCRREEWEVWPRGTRILSLTLGPRVLSQITRLAIIWNLVWKTISWGDTALGKQVFSLLATSNKPLLLLIWLVKGVQRNHFSPTLTVSWALQSLIIDTPGWISLFIHPRKHSLSIYWGKCARWGIIKEDEGQKVPTLKEIKSIIMKQTNSTNSLQFQVWCTDQRPGSTFWKPVRKAEFWGPPQDLLSQNMHINSSTEDPHEYQRLRSTDTSLPRAEPLFSLN